MCVGCFVINPLITNLLYEKYLVKTLKPYHTFLFRIFEYWINVKILYQYFYSNFTEDFSDNTPHFRAMLSSRLLSRRHGLLFMSVRTLGFEPHKYDHQKSKNRDSHMKLEKLQITVPVPVQSRALKRHRNPKIISATLDREKLKQKKIIISSKRSELNHRMSQQYGTFDKLPLGKI